MKNNAPTFRGPDKNLMACLEQSEALSRKAKPIAFLFKATTASERTK
jgi:hypothetical protein